MSCLAEISFEHFSLIRTNNDLLIKSKGENTENIPNNKNMVSSIYNFICFRLKLIFLFFLMCILESVHLIINKLLRDAIRRLTSA